MRLLLTGGGTAGHINPAIAIADTVKRKLPHACIAFVGTPNGMEKRLVEEAGYPMYPIRMQGFTRTLSLHNIRTAYLALTSPRAAKKILEEFSPSLVIGTGGYVSWPLLRAAASVGIPTALHESNALPGLTTRRLAPYMDALWLNFCETAAHWPPRCVCRNRGFKATTRPSHRMRAICLRGLPPPVFPPTHCPPAPSPCHG
jgi:UDP-N-acetylglucosamine--N-acetylmuramyl-(pentapeptide) pyrophosphoryl-undecaprenol N-acetylglucosamine transferase